VLRGDINGDGKVSGLDVSLVARRLNQPATGPYDKADINGDGKDHGARHAPDHDAVHQAALRTTDH
jgi:hypothetical protein